MVGSRELKKGIYITPFFLHEALCVLATHYAPERRQQAGGVLAYSSCYNTDAPG